LSTLEIPVINRSHRAVSIVLKGERLNQAIKLRYLGSTVSENGLIDREINRRLSKFSQNAGFLHTLLKARSVPNRAKKIILVGILRPISLYGVETWTITRTNMSRLVAADMKVVRLIRGVTR